MIWWLWGEVAGIEYAKEVVKKMKMIKGRMEGNKVESYLCTPSQQGPTYPNKFILFFHHNAFLILTALPFRAYCIQNALIFHIILGLLFSLNTMKCGVHNFTKVLTCKFVSYHISDVIVCRTHDNMDTLHNLPHQSTIEGIAKRQKLSLCWNFHHNSYSSVYRWKLEIYQKVTHHWQAATSTSTTEINAHYSPLYGTHMYLSRLTMITSQLLSEGLCHDRTLGLTIMSGVSVLFRLALVDYGLYT
jgi:hypothetical protein